MTPETHRVSRRRAPSSLVRLALAAIALLLPALAGATPPPSGGGEPAAPAPTAPPAAQPAAEDPPVAVADSRFAGEFASPEAYLDWVASFYRHKDFARVPRAMGYLCSSPLYSDRDYRFGAAAFYGEIFKQSDAAARAAWEALTAGNELQEIVLVSYAAWFADTPVCQQLLVRARQQWRESEQLRSFFNGLYQTKVFDPFVTDTRDFFYREPVRFHILLAKVHASGDYDAMLAVIGAVNWTISPESMFLRPAGEVALNGLRRLIAQDEWARSVVRRQAEQHENRDVRRILRELLGMPPEADAPQKPR